MRVKMLLLFLIVSVNLFALEQVPYMSSYDNDYGHSCRMIIPAYQFSINESDLHAPVAVGISTFIYKKSFEPVKTGIGQTLTTDFLQLWIDFSDNPDDFNKIRDSEYRVEYQTSWDTPFASRQGVMSEYPKAEFDTENKLFYISVLSGGVLPDTSSIMKALSNNQPFLLKLIGKENKTVLLITVYFSNDRIQADFVSLVENFDKEYWQYRFELSRL